MAPIVKCTSFGDTIFVSHPSYAAEGLIFWASMEYGYSQHTVETLENGYVKVDIPGLTSITFALGNN